MLLRISSFAAPPRLAALAFAAAITVAGCTSSIGPTPDLALSDRGAAYRLGLGDKLKIVVFGEENLSGQFEVSPTGNIALPLVGELPAKGQTVAEFRGHLASRLGDGYLKSPRVTVDIVNYRPVYVHGEVRTGGEVPYKSGMRLRDAIALAGGYTYRADESFVSLGRGDQPERQVRMTGESAILPGDNIRVPERIF